MGGTCQLQDGGAGEGWGLVGAPEGCRTRMEAAHPQPMGRGSPGTVLSHGSHPRFSLPAPESSAFGQGLGADSAPAASRAQSSLHLWGILSWSCKEAQCSPSGFISLRGLPHLGGRQSQAQPSSDQGSDVAATQGLCPMSQAGGHAWLAFWL